MNTKIVWSPNTASYGSGEIATIGRVKVGSVFWHGSSRNNPLVWRAAINLPGITLKEGTTDFADIEEAKARLERAVATWFAWLEG